MQLPATHRVNDATSFPIKTTFAKATTTRTDYSVLDVYPEFYMHFDEVCITAWQDAAMYDNTQNHRGVHASAGIGKWFSPIFTICGVGFCKCNQMTHKSIVFPIQFNQHSNKLLYKYNFWFPIKSIL